MDTDREGGQTESCRSPAVQISAISAKLLSYLKLGQDAAVSYTHLTLPTSDLV